MKVVVQKSKEASVWINGKEFNKIDGGLVLLVGFTYGDTIDTVDYMVKKVVNLRIFDDENGVMNMSILEYGGEILSISQFTLYGDATKGNRPSYIKAMKGEESVVLYEEFNKKLNEFVPTKPGVFGADMNVHLINAGPTTIILEK